MRNKTFPLLLLLLTCGIVFAQNRISDHPNKDAADLDANDLLLSATPGVATWKTSVGSLDARFVHLASTNAFVSLTATTIYLGGIPLTSANIVDASITNNIVLYPTNSGPSKITNGLAQFWNSNSVVWLRTSKVAATNFVDTLIAVPPP